MMAVYFAFTSLLVWTVKQRCQILKIKETSQPQRETTKDLGFMSTNNSYLFSLILKYTCIISSQSSPPPLWHSLYCYDPNCGSHVLAHSQKWPFYPYSDLSLTFQSKQYNVCNIKFCLTKCYHQYFTEMYPGVTI